MILPAIRRILVVVFGFVLAAISAAIALFMLGARWAAQEASDGALQNPDEISQVLNQGLGLVAFFFNVAPVLTFLPAVAVAAIGEVAKINSFLYYVIAGGFAAVMMPLIAAPEGIESSTYSAQYFVIIATAGFVGGGVYWLIAGRNA